MFEPTIATKTANVTELPVLPELPSTMKHLPADVVTAILASSPDAKQTVKLVANRTTDKGIVKASRDFILTVGHASDWTPVFQQSATHKIGQAAGKRTEFDEMLTSACAVRGGTVLTVPFAFKPDNMGFPVADYRPTVKGLESAFFRVLDDDDARRIDIRNIRIIANDPNEKNAAKTAGYVLVRVKGYRVK